MHQHKSYSKLVLRRKGSKLLERTCHACLPHPAKKDCLLIFCGYSETSDFCNDVVLLNTTRYMTRPPAAKLMATKHLPCPAISKGNNEELANRNICVC